MFFIISAMLVVVVIALLVVGYVAYPYRGADLPLAPKAGRWMRRHLDEIPTSEVDDIPLSHR